MKVTAYIVRPKLSAALQFKKCSVRAYSVAPKEVVASVTTRNVQITINQNADPVLEQRLQDLEFMISSLQVFTFSVNVDLFDNVEDAYTVDITGIEASKSYYLKVDSAQEGVAAFLVSWVDGTVTLAIKNNSGFRYTAALDFTINEIFKP